MKRNKNLLQNVETVSVSQCIPVYINGKIKYWKVNVGYAGNLAMNLTSVNAWRDIYNKNPKAFYENPAYYDALRIILKPNLLLPEVKHMTGFFKYNPEKNISELEYAWRDGLFWRGSERAWQFRIQMLAQMNKQKEQH